jgi:cytochrome c5
MLARSASMSSAVSVAASEGFELSGKPAALDLRIRQRGRLGAIALIGGGAREPGDRRRAAHDVPRGIGHHHLDEDVSGKQLPGHRAPLAVLDLDLVLGGDDHLEDLGAQVHRLDALLERCLHLVLIPGVGLHDVPGAAIVGRRHPDVARPLGPGPAITEASAYNPAEGDSANGGELFRTNCSGCHNFTGQGGALTHGKYAPNLEDVDPKHIFEVMLTGSQAMPSFPNSVMPPQEKRDIIAWLDAVNTSDAPSPGGFSLGGYGPVSEGLFAWTFGIGLMVAAAVWVGAHTAKARKS